MESWVNEHSLPGPGYLNNLDVHRDLFSFDKNDNAINNCLTHMITTSWLHQQSVQIKNINLKYNFYGTRYHICG